MTRVLLTGASGFTFSNVLGYMLEHTDWNFVCPCSWRHKGNPLNLQKYADNPRVTIISHDLTAPLPDLGDFTYIINGASQSHVDRSIIDPVPFIENNISSTLQVLEYARKTRPAVFIQFSTDEVYGSFKNLGCSPGHLLPANPYAASKAAQEVIAMGYWRTYSIPMMITNSNNIVGPNQDPEKFVPKLIRQISNGELVRVHTGNHGELGRRFYNPVQNVADALLFILNLQPVRAIRPQGFDIPGGEQLDNLQMAQLIAELLDKPLRYVLTDVEQTIRPGYDQFYPEPDDALIAMGWTPPFTLQEGLTWVKEGR